MAAATPAHNNPLIGKRKKLRHEVTIDDSYMDYLLAEDMHTGEDGTNETGEVAPILSGTTARN